MFEMNSCIVRLDTYKHVFGITFHESLFTNYCHATWYKEVLYVIRPWVFTTKVYECINLYLLIMKKNPDHAREISLYIYLCDPFVTNWLLLKSHGILFSHRSYMSDVFRAGSIIYHSVIQNIKPIQLKLSTLCYHVIIHSTYPLFLP